MRHHRCWGDKNQLREWDLSSHRPTMSFSICHVAKLAHSCSLMVVYNICCVRSLFFAPCTKLVWNLSQAPPASQTRDHWDNASHYFKAEHYFLYLVIVLNNPSLAEWLMMLWRKRTKNHIPSFPSLLCLNFEVRNKTGSIFAKNERRNGAGLGDGMSCVEAVGCVCRVKYSGLRDMFWWGNRRVHMNGCFSVWFVYSGLP